MCRGLCMPTPADCRIPTFFAGISVLAKFIWTLFVPLLSAGYLLVFSNTINSVWKDSDMTVVPIVKKLTKEGLRIWIFR
jgi:hypothetical protein